jgi:hypothetical protein
VIDSMLPIDHIDEYNISTHHFAAIMAGSRCLRSRT